MEKIFLNDAKNKKIEPYLVRYFKYQTDYYLIYTFCEIDEKNFMKLYVVKVLEELGSPISKNLSEDWEWEQMQSVVKHILKEIKKEQIQSFKDVNFTDILGMKVEHPRSFKLLSTLVDVLSGDKQKDETIIEDRTEIPEEIKDENISDNTSKISNATQDITEVLNLDQSKKEQFIASDLNQEKVIANADDKSDVDLVKSINQKTAESYNNLFDIEPVIDTQPIEEINIKEISRIDELEDLPNIEIPNFDPIDDEKSIDRSLYEQLQQENEDLKKQLLQYQVKYQTIKDLIAKDE